MAEVHPAATPQAEWLARLAQAGNYNAWIFRSIRPYLRGRVLEVGCGTGALSALIAAAADHLTAIDIEPGFVDEARRRLGDRPGVSIVHGDATRDLPDVAFETVVMLDVLEHIADDAAMLGRLAERLEAGGQVVLKVPALPGLHNSLDRAVGHHRRYDGPALRRIAGAAGLSVSRITPFNVAGIPGWWWNGLLGRSVAPAGQIGGFDRMVPILERIERVLPPPVGLSYVVVLRKPPG